MKVNIVCSNCGKIVSKVELETKERLAYIRACGQCEKESPILHDFERQMMGFKALSLDKLRKVEDSMIGFFELQMEGIVPEKRFKVNMKESLMKFVKRNEK